MCAHRVLGWARHPTDRQDRAAHKSGVGETQRCRPHERAKPTRRGDVRTVR